MLSLQAFLPLFQKFDKNRIAAQLNPSIDPNVLKDPTTSTATDILDPYKIVGNIVSNIENVNPVQFQQEDSSTSKP